MTLCQIRTLSLFHPSEFKNLENSDLDSFSRVCNWGINCNLMSSLCNADKELLFPHLFVLTTKSTHSLERWLWWDSNVASISRTLQGSAVQGQRRHHRRRRLQVRTKRCQRSLPSRSSCAVWRLHYGFTTYLLLFSSFLVTGKVYLGNPIQVLT